LANLLLWNLTDSLPHSEVAAFTLAKVVLVSLLPGRNPAAHGPGEDSREAASGLR
jgi:hypothetical protein